MTTQSHAIINLALLSRQGKPYLHRYALIGAILPDLAMFIFFAVETFVRRTPQQELWSQRYFMPAWQNFFDIFNSIPFILLVLGLGYFLVKSEKITVLAWSMLIHCGFDFFLHNDDAHHHFFPLSDFAFQSPVSYWDAAHYGHIVAPIEVLATLAVSVYMFRRLQTRASRWVLVGVNVFSVMGYFVFVLI